MAELVVSRLTKEFGAVRAIDGVSFTVADGEFVSLLGPSGCGKSTTLAAIAGLDMPTAGLIRAGQNIFFDGESSRFVEPEARNCGLVFQSYALWPHMTVAQNVDFPLKLRKLERKERKRRVDEVLALVEMTHLADRYPHQLSGGQQQRVALARTLVYRPAVLLLDEPLSNLDAKLRDRARSWLLQLKEQLRLTTIYVTHDQVEAMSLSDRIVLMDGGRVMQIGTPKEIYEAPANPFVADFIGTSSFFDGELTSAGATGRVRIAGDSEIAVAGTTRIPVGAPVTVAIRPDRLSIIASGAGAPDEAGTALHGRVVSRSYLGGRYQHEISIAQTLLRIDGPYVLEQSEVHVWVPASSCLVFERGASRPRSAVRH